jgi:tetratricopeptide (TPR) repeat protein
MAEVDLASWFVSRAVEAYGDRVLVRAGESDTAGPQAAGRELARLIFGRAEAAASVPAPVAIEIGVVGSRDAGVALDAAIEELLEADPGLSAVVAEVLAGYYRQQLESGDGQDLVELGDLLWFDEPELARAAFERAVDAGNRRALIRLATHRRVVSGDYEGAVALYQQAVTSPEPGIAAEGLTELGEALRDHGDYQAARAAWEQCIATGNPPGRLGDRRRGQRDHRGHRPGIPGPGARHGRVRLSRAAASDLIAREPRTRGLPGKRGGWKTPGSGGRHG